MSLEMFLILLLAASLTLLIPTVNGQEEAAAEPTPQTDWQLCAHGSSRSRAHTNSMEWTARTPTSGFHIPYWQVPFGEGPELAGGVNQRVRDGHIHVPLLGDVQYNGNPDEPAGGSLKRWSPALVWEIDGTTGKTVRLYNLSEYADCFNSVLRYTDDGYPVVAGYSHHGYTILVLDKVSTGVTRYSAGSVEPQLLQISTTDPPQILWGDIDADAAVDLNGHEVQPNTMVKTTAISAIICGADGHSIYNDGFFNHDTGIYRFELPLTSNSKASLFISGCYTKPWIVASDTQRRIFAQCQTSKEIRAWDRNGHQLWSVSMIFPWLSLSDDERVVLVGDSNNWVGLDSNTGKAMWRTSASEAFGNNVSCSYSAQPWAPRHPIPFNDGSLAFLCSENKVAKMMVLSVETGKAMSRTAEFDFAPDMITADASYNVYAYGSVNDLVTVQKKSLRM